MDDPLSESAPVPADSGTPIFDGLLEGWLNREGERAIRAAMHRLDLERAGQPPVIQITFPGVAGTFTGIAGSPDVTYSAAPP
jgi:hypothetical protein